MLRTVFLLLDGIGIFDMIRILCTDSIIQLTNKNLQEYDEVSDVPSSLTAMNVFIIKR